MMLYLFCQLQSTIASHRAGSPTQLTARRPVRGATFVEYAILAAIAVGIGYIFRTQLGNVFNSVFDQVGNALDDIGSR